MKGKRVGENGRCVDWIECGQIHLAARLHHHIVHLCRGNDTRPAQGRPRHHRDRARARRRACRIRDQKRALLNRRALGIAEGHAVVSQRKNTWAIFNERTSYTGGG